MDNPVEEVKKRLDIVEFIGSFITLKKAGRNFKAICPFHQEKSPSFIVSPERQIWHCFGACGEGGDVVKFLMKWENITFFEALRELALKTGVKLARISLEDKAWKKKERYLNMNMVATEYYSHILNSTNYGKKGLSYLDSRHIKPAVSKKFQLGYSPNSWDSLNLFLKKKNYSEEEAAENGLLVKGEKGSYYDRFRGRLMFPIKDGRGNVIAFSGRSLEKDEKQAKYINSPETPVYHKRETLFGIDLARQSIKKDGNVFIVEGEFDVITPFQHGFTNFVAIKGTALTNEQLLLLKRYTEKITLVFDADPAGEESVRRGIEEAERLDLEVRVAKLDYAKDPDEAINKDLTKFKKTTSHPIPIYDFLIDIAKKKYPENSPFSKKKIADEVIPFISRILNPIVKSHYVKKMAKFLDVSENSIENQMFQLKKRQRRTSLIKPINVKTSSEGRALVIEKYVLSYMFQSDDALSAGKRIFMILTPDHFFLQSHQKISQFFLREMSKSNFDPNRFAGNLPSELRPAFDEIFLFASSDHDLSDDKIEKLLFEIKKFYLKRKIKLILSGDVEGSENRKKLSVLSNELKEVEKKLVSL